MTRILRISLLTLGDPSRLTGGYLYHRRMASLAHRFDAEVRFVSFPDRPFPLPVLATPSILRHVSTMDADAVVVDSIIAAYLGPRLAIGRTVETRSVARRTGREPTTARRYAIDRVSAGGIGTVPPLIGMLHQPPGGIDHGSLRTRMQAWLDMLTYPRCRLLMVASDSLAETLLNAGAPAHQVRVVPPGRDVLAPVSQGDFSTTPTRAVPTADHTWSRDELRQGRLAAFLCVGNWMERKGILDVVDAFAMLPEETGTLHLVGDTSVERAYAANVRRQLAAPHLSQRVVVHGPLSLQAVASLYEAADVFVLPSRKEPFGTVYGEAMAYGLPVIGWRAGNLPYLATDGEEGLLVNTGDIVGLAGALERLAIDEPLRLRLGAAARQRALARPTWEESAALFFDAVRSASTGPAT